MQLERQRRHYLKLIMIGAPAAVCRGKGRGKGTLVRRAVDPDWREKIVVRIKADKELAAAEFDTLDAPGDGKVDLQKFKQIVTKINGGKEPNLAAWDFIVVSLTADANSSAPFTEGVWLIDYEQTVVMTKAAVLRAVTRYCYYVAHMKDIDEIFKMFDKDKSGDWDRDQLQRAMDFSENANGRERTSAGMIMKMPVSEADVTFVLEQLGLPADGKVDSNHAQQALAVWHAIADVQFEKNKSMPCCIVL